MDEKEAIGRLKRGDIRALAVLVQKYQLQAIRAAYLVTQDHALAEDIVQSSFLRAFERIDQFDEQRPFGPWFLRLIVNAALRGTAQRDKALSLDKLTGLDDEMHNLEGLLVDPSPDALFLLEQAETRQMVADALGKLSAAQRSVIVLRYYHGLSEADITQRLACPQGTVGWRLHAARKRLRILLEGLLPG